MTMNTSWSYFKIRHCNIWFFKIQKKEDRNEKSFGGTTSRANYCFCGV